LHHRSLWDDDDNGHHDGRCVHYFFCSSSFIVSRFILLFNSFLLESKWVALETIHQTGYFQRRQISIISRALGTLAHSFRALFLIIPFFLGKKEKMQLRTKKK